ncbi:MAG: CidA/LrgA family protein [Desulfuromonas sp.]|uniref:CidA/LrgA family protein n=1 Tax=Desulfuromonas sp. TaxID=892 RepID=UPI000CC2C5AB|nr:CidA/LrgA family protein [Desulfuromonas sp.]PLX84865.1 MAG: CidA/LrgA family protein [Desulfuromonas sp.]
MIRGFAILVLLQLLGETISLALDLPIPGSVIGMGLLVAALRLELVRFEWVREAAELLLSHLALLFVPAGVGVMVYFDLIGREWLPIVVATVVSTFAVMAVTGWTARLLDGRGERHGG